MIMKHSNGDDDDVELNVLGCQVDILGTNYDQCVSMVQCCFTSTETIRLIGTGRPGGLQLLNSLGKPPFQITAI